MLLSSVFPSLFAESAAVSANFYGGAEVVKLSASPEVVVIKQSERKPLAWFLHHLVQVGFDMSVFQRMEIRSNSDDSISVWER
jgi:hypothetical protein